jgi:hypothetical protein
MITGREQRKKTIFGQRMPIFWLNGVFPGFDFLRAMRARWKADRVRLQPKIFHGSVTFVYLASAELLFSFE